MLCSNRLSYVAPGPHGGQEFWRDGSPKSIRWQA